mmetsp:Transcript_39367/g.47730  ORF Transcript_39367/g.47730 Transcript_39367/m.47730 type:complete len:227 (+) Transcript_39367:361-1041(+)
MPVTLDNKFSLAKQVLRCDNNVHQDMVHLFHQPSFHNERELIVHAGGSSDSDCHSLEPWFDGGVVHDVFECIHTLHSMQDPPHADVCIVWGRAPQEGSIFANSSHPLITRLIESSTLVIYIVSLLQDHLGDDIHHHSPSNSCCLSLHKVEVARLCDVIKCLPCLFSSAVQIWCEHVNKPRVHPLAPLLLFLKRSCGWLDSLLCKPALLLRRFHLRYSLTQRGDDVC